MILIMRLLNTSADCSCIVRQAQRVPHDRQAQGDALGLASAPFEGLTFQGIDRFQRLLVANGLGLARAGDGLGQHDVIAR